MKKKYILATTLILVFCLFALACAESPTTEQVTEKEILLPTTTEKATPPTTIAPPTTKPVAPKVDVMVQEFVKLGFTQTEAKEMKEIFAAVGITEIHNVRYAVGSGIDNLQSFTCDIYDYHADKGGVSVQFTVDKRQLCFISLNGIPTTKTDYAYINIFGNVKFKTSNSKKSVTLYDIWDENGEIDSNATGYKAVFDYENKKITNYEE